MRVYVDKDDEGVDEFAYTNADGRVESVKMCHYGDETCDEKSHVSIEGDETFESFLVYVSDIPKLIKALQAAHSAYTLKANNE